MEWPHILTAMVTPFAPDNTVDTAQAQRLAQWLVRHGTEGLVLAGTTGESPTLSFQERHQLFTAVRQAVPSIPIWMGTGANDTQHSIELTQAAEAWGADGIMLVTPYYNKPPQEGLYRHFTAIAATTHLPVVLYNVPGRTGANLEPQTVARIMHHSDNVLGIKEAAASLPQLQQLVEVCPDYAKVYTGDDALYFSALAVGAWGVVSVASHLVGDAMAEMTAAFLAGNLARAREMNATLTPIFQELFCLSNPIPLKWAMNRVGLTVGDLRLPLCFPSDSRVFHHLNQLIAELVSEESLSDWHLLTEAH